MVRSEHPALVGQELLVGGDRLGKAARAAEQLREVVAGGQGVAVVRSECLVLDDKELLVPRDRLDEPTCAGEQ